MKSRPKHYKKKQLQQVWRKFRCIKIEESGSIKPHKQTSNIWKIVCWHANLLQRYWIVCRGPSCHMTLGSNQLSTSWSVARCRVQSTRWDYHGTCRYSSRTPCSSVCYPAQTYHNLQPSSKLHRWLSGPFYWISLIVRTPGMKFLGIPLCSNRPCSCHWS